MLSYFSNLIYQNYFTKFDQFTQLSYSPNIVIGIYDESKKQGIKILSDEKIYQLVYCKKMDNGLLIMFENEIRFRIWNEKSTIIIHVFSIEHNFDHQVIIPEDKVKTLRFFKFGNTNLYVKNLEIDLIFDFINSIHNLNNDKNSSKFL